MPSFARTLGVLIALALGASQMGLTDAKIQASSFKPSPQAAQRAAEVKASFEASYKDYKKYAFGQDELLPLTKEGTGGFGNWGATIIDAMDTMQIMGLDNLYSEALTFAKQVDFTKTNQTTISLFETNIRYVGGLLSSYEIGGKKEQKLVDQAKVIGDHLVKGWVGSNDIPFNTLHWNTGMPDTTTGAIIAEAGTLLLELSRLTKYTGDNKYLDLAQRSMKAVINSQAVFPGLYGQGINPATKQPTDDYVTWGGGSDSFFEYLNKYYQLAPSKENEIYIDTWIDSVQSSIEHLITKAEGHDLTYLTDYSKKSGGNIPRFSHLGCFVGGNWLLGGKLLGNQDFVDYGYKLTESCINTYEKSATGLGPESFNFIGAGGNTNGVTINNKAFYDKAGFDYDNVQYILRPEVLESVWYAWRISGDSIWQDRAYTAFKALKKYCKAPAALAGIVEVNNTRTDQFNDSESFLYAELYKYLYLTFADPEEYSLDKYVFNTEAHPYELDHTGSTGKSGSVTSAPSPQMTHQATGTSHDSPPAPFFSSVPTGAKVIQQAIQGVVDDLLNGGGKGKKTRQSRRGSH